jgi:chromosome segregation ATPase
MPPIPPHPEALVAFAASRTGEFLARYREILAEAFSRHGLILNAKQLRELAGGGSQTTAQRAIDDWRQALSERLATRVRLGAEVPEEVLQAANTLLESLWGQARDHAAQEFAQERVQHEAAQEEVSARLAAIRQELLEVRSELERAKELVTERDAQLRELRSEITQARDCLAQAARDLHQERQARAEQASQARQAQEGLERSVQDAQAHCEQLRQDTIRAQKDASQRFDRMLVEHREAVASVQRSCDARLAERESQMKALQSRLEAAAAQELTLQMQAVRSSQQIEHLGLQAAAMRAELDLARGDLQACRDQVQVTQAQLIAHLQAGAPGSDRIEPVNAVQTPKSGRKKV